MQLGLRLGLQFEPVLSKPCKLALNLLGGVEMLSNFKLYLIIGQRDLLSAATLCSFLASRVLVSLRRGFCGVQFVYLRRLRVATQNFL